MTPQQQDAHDCRDYKLGLNHNLEYRDGQVGNGHVQQRVGRPVEYGRDRYPEQITRTTVKPFLEIFEAILGHSAR